ncbi:MAG: transcription termination/antitermination protein NusG [Proteobacteria bacterium]|nr:transcription termination/antitermination protein NusG [Pseudomonadota bacterium]
MTHGSRWYVVNVYSGFEKKVADHIREQAAKKGLAEQIEMILVPTEEVVEIKKGAKTTSERQFFPGYVLIKMQLSDEVWHLVRHTPKVSGFLGARGKPTPVSQGEVDRILAQVQEGIQKPKSTISFDVGEQVRVSEGPFSSFNGIVEEVDEEKQRLKVAVSIFGRSTPIDLDFVQVEKI